MGVNKVIYGGETLVDLTGDSVTADTLAEGATAHDASGAIITGRMATILKNLTIDGVSYNGTADVDFTETIEAMIAAASSGGGVEMVTGYYTGANKYNSANKNTLTFSTLPKLVIIMKSSLFIGTIASSTVRVVPMAVFVNMGSSGYGFVTPGTNAQYNYIKTVFSGNSVSWYSDDTAAVQMNESARYYYVAFC